MNYFEYSISDIKKNLLYNRKRMLLIVCVCIVMGIVAGYMESIEYKQINNKYDNTVISNVNISEIPKNEEYYYKVFCVLKKAYSSINAYYSYLNTLDLHGESKELLNDFEESLSSFNEEYNILRNYYCSNTPIICNDNEATKIFIKTNLSIVNESIQDTDRIIEEISGNLFFSTYRNTSESTELKKKVSLEKSFEIWSKQLELVCNGNIDDIEFINKRMDSLIEVNLEKQNNVITDFNDIVAYIEKREQYDIIYNFYLLDLFLKDGGVADELSQDEILNNKKNQALVYARSIAGIDSACERFYSIMIFFVLFGITVSLLYGSFKGVNKAK